MNRATRRYLGYAPVFCWEDLVDMSREFLDHIEQCYCLPLGGLVCTPCRERWCCQHCVVLAEREKANA